MSCFIMDYRALATLARGIERLLNTGYETNGFEAPTALYLALDGCRDKFGFFEERKIFAALYDLNGRAYCGRYPDETQTPCPPWPGDLLEDPDHPERPTEPAQLLRRPEWMGGYWQPAPDTWKFLKLIDCFNYQTLEDATQYDALRVAMEKLAHALTGFLARNCDVYNAAKWGEV